jgi:hypothetical protein
VYHFIEGVDAAMYAENDILFPYASIPALRKLRGEAWAKLVDHITTLPENHEETLAFMLMMVRLNGCLSCETDSYRAMRGCLACSQQTLRRFKGTDESLHELFQTALRDVQKFARDNPRLTIATTLSS